MKKGERFMPMPIGSGDSLINKIAGESLGKVKTYADGRVNGKLEREYIGLLINGAKSYQEYAKDSSKGIPTSNGYFNVDADSAIEDHLLNKVLEKIYNNEYPATEEYKKAQNYFLAESKVFLSKHVITDFLYLDSNIGFLRYFVQDKKVNLNSSFDGKIPLIYTSEYHCSKNAEFLIANGADVNIKDANGLTPLMHVSHNAHSSTALKTAEVLINKGANVSFRNKHGQSAIGMCCNFYGGPDQNLQAYVKLLVDHGAKANSDDLIKAINGLDIEIVELILKAGVDDINGSNKYGETALSAAVRLGDQNKIKLLKQYLKP
jgi:hypothetical protein